MKVTLILDFWRSGGKWWLNEPPRDYYLLELETGDVWEVFKEVAKSGSPDLAEASWTLSRMTD